MKKKIYLVLYYGFARFLPASTSILGGEISKNIRYSICKHIFKHCGSNVNIERLAWFGNGSNIEIGNNSGIGIRARVHNNTIIGENVMMGPNCYMLESSHRFEQIDIPMISQGFVNKKNQVVIEDDIWIGRDVMIIGNKTIKSGSIIGARCVLTKNFPEYSIIGGNPSRMIRQRT